MSRLKDLSNLGIEQSAVDEALVEIRDQKIIT